MSRIVLAVLAASLLSFAFAAAPAQAVLITVNFTVNRSPADFSNPPSASGSFSFDSSLIPAGGGDIHIGSGIPINAALFTWSGVTWNKTNSFVDVLQFDSSGQLTGFRYFAGAGPSLDVNPDFLVRTFTDGTTDFEYKTGGVPYMGSVVSWSTDQVTASEPAAWWLLATACVGMVASRRRSRQS